MDIAGTYTFNAPPDRVWNILMDPQVISSCIPGCEAFEPLGEDRIRGDAFGMKLLVNPLRNAHLTHAVHVAGMRAECQPIQRVLQPQVFRKRCAGQQDRGESQQPQGSSHTCENPSRKRKFWLMPIGRADPLEQRRQSGRVVDAVMPQLPDQRQDSFHGFQMRLAHHGS